MIYKIIRKARWKFIKISRIYFKSIYRNTDFILAQRRYNKIDRTFQAIRNQLSRIGRRLLFCFYTRLRKRKYAGMWMIEYRTLKHDVTAYLASYKIMRSFAWLSRMQQLFKRMYVYYFWLVKQKRQFRNTLTISRKKIYNVKLRRLRKRLDDAIIRPACGFISAVYTRRRRCQFRGESSCFLLSWYQGIKFGTFSTFRSKFAYKRLRDRRRKKKLYKDYQKKLKKFRHSVDENKRLVRGKRKKPKKKHIVYYK